MLDIPVLNQLLEIVGDVGAEIVAPRRQLADGQLVRADIEQNKTLNAVDVVYTGSIKLTAQDFEELAVQSLNQANGFAIYVVQGGYPSSWAWQQNLELSALKFP